MSKTALEIAQEMLGLKQTELNESTSHFAANKAEVKRIAPLLDLRKGELMRTMASFLAQTENAARKATAKATLEAAKAAIKEADAEPYNKAVHEAAEEYYQLAKAAGDEADVHEAAAVLERQQKLANAAKAQTEIEEARSVLCHLKRCRTGEKHLAEAEAAKKAAETALTNVEHQIEERWQENILLQQKIKMLKADITRIERAISVLSVVEAKLAEEQRRAEAEEQRRAEAEKQRIQVKLAEERRRQKIAYAVFTGRIDPTRGPSRPTPRHVRAQMEFRTSYKK